MSSSRRPPGAVFILAALAISLGALPLLVRVDVPATHLVGMRVTLGAVVLVPLLRAREGTIRPGGDVRRLFALAAILGAHWVTFFVAIKLTTIAVALAVVYLGPVAAVVLAGPVLGERVGRRAVIGLVLAVSGTMLVVRPGGGVTTGGLVAAVVSASLFAAFMLVGKPAAGRRGGLVVATWELVFAALIFAPFTIQAARSSLDAWPQFLLLGAVFTGLGGAVFWSSMRHLPVAVVSVIMYLEPASAVVWAAVVLAEFPGVAGWVGVTLVIVGGMVAALDAAEEVAVGASAAL